MSVKIVSMIAHLKAAVKKVSQRFPTIPKLESPGNYLASDSDVLSFLVRLITPGLSSLFPLVAASIVGSLMPGAASPGGDR